METSTAGAGLPDDQAGVQFHFFTLGGIATPDTQLLAGDGATGGYWRGDGDSATDPPATPAPPILTSWTEIVRSQPIGYLIIDGAPAGPATGGTTAMSWTFQRDANGTIVGATTAAGGHAGQGDAEVLASKYADTNPLVQVGEIYYTPNDSALPLDNDALILASRDAAGNWTVVDVAHGGHCVASLLSLLGAARAVIGQLQAAAGSQMGFDAAWKIAGDAIKKAGGIQ